ncbi:ECF transporter S component [Eubacterium sp. AB3007]|uniref:ECF transporter S component n=1 Tax=Eubacterium sp. AB3007 TaxID=1392487 RepID=UPI000689D281|nr:ECF transporter S component [Eubacterium sp. AB3007]
MRARTDLSDMTQYAAAAQKRTHVAALLILGLMPLTILAVTFLLGSNLYMVGSLLIIVYTMVPFFMVFERRRPKAREIVLIAMMSALTVVIHLFFHLTIPLQAGTAMVIISGISLGPEAGFLVGALARFVCNFYMGQGPWTPWQMFCWGMLGFLAGLAFNKIDYAQVRNRTFRESIASRSFQVVMGPVLCVLFAAALAYISYLIVPGEDQTFFGWRLYVFGALGLLAGVLLQRRRLPVDGVTMALFTFFTVFILYGGIMNVCAMVTSSVMPGGRPISLNTLRLLYISGVPYDASHALTAAVFIFLFGDLFIRKLERIKIKYGIYR